MRWFFSFQLTQGHFSSRKLNKYNELFNTKSIQLLDLNSRFTILFFFELFSSYGEAKAVLSRREHLEKMVRCRGNVAQMRQTRPDSGLSFQTKVLKPFNLLPLRLEAEGVGCGGKG